MNRERKLEQQVRLLADRLAILAAIFMDCKGIQEQRPEVWHALLCAALTDGKDLDLWRDRPEYKDAMVQLRELVREA